MKRGTVAWAELVPRSGSEQQGRRPVVVVSHDGFNLTPTWRSLIVVPLSRSSRQKRRGPTAILLRAGSAGLAEESVALCHQVTTLDRAKVGEVIGLLQPQEMRAVERGLLAALGVL